MTWLLEVYVIFSLWCFIVEIFMHVSCELFEDVTSISWKFIICAWFIALIEVGRYKLVSEPCRSCPDQNPVNYLLYLNGILSYLRYLLWYFVFVLTCWLCSRCMRHVRKYCRYLFLCSVRLGAFELSGGEAFEFRCILYNRIYLDIGFG